MGARPRFRGRAPPEHVQTHLALKPPQEPPFSTPPQLGRISYGPGNERQTRESLRKSQGMTNELLLLSWTTKPHYLCIIDDAYHAGTASINDAYHAGTASINESVPRVRLPSCPIGNEACDSLMRLCET